MTEEPSNTLLHSFQQMLRIRRVEEAIANRYHEQAMRCPTHLCIGEEAIAVGVASQLKSSDKVFSNHRAHGHYLAKGGSLPKLIAELYGRSTGCCGGWGGSMHLIDLDAGFMGSTPIVGGTVPLAGGMAWATQYQKQADVVVVFFGEGCFEEGVLHETMNFAALKKLPLVMICENNDYSVMTPLRERQPDRAIHLIAEAHGLTSYAGDGNDVEQVANLAKQAIDRARYGLGPQFLEFKTHRWPEHCGPNEDDDMGYRPAGELAAWKQRCPLQLSQSLLQRKTLLSSTGLSKIEQSIKQEVEEAFAFALNSPEPALTRNAL